MERSPWPAQPTVTLTIDSTGAVTQSAAITVHNLSLTGSGSVVLVTAGNHVAGALTSSETNDVALCRQRRPDDRNDHGRAVMISSCKPEVPSSLGAITAGAGNVTLNSSGTVTQDGGHLRHRPAVAWQRFLIC